MALSVAVIAVVPSLLLLQGRFEIEFHIYFMALLILLMAVIVDGLCIVLMSIIKYFPITVSGLGLVATLRLRGFPGLLLHHNVAPL